MDQHETGQAMLFLGHHDINQAEIFMSSFIKLVINKKEAHTSSRHIYFSTLLTSQCRDKNMDLYQKGNHSHTNKHTNKGGHSFAAKEFIIW